MASTGPSSARGEANSKRSGRGVGWRWRGEFDLDQEWKCVSRQGHGTADAPYVQENRSARFGIDGLEKSFDCAFDR